MPGCPPSRVGYHLAMQHGSHASGVNVNGAELLREMIKFSI